MWSYDTVQYSAVWCGAVCDLPAPSGRGPPGARASVQHGKRYAPLGGVAAVAAAAAAAAAALAEARRLPGPGPRRPSVLRPVVVTPAAAVAPTATVRP